MNNLNTSTRFIKCKFYEVNTNELSYKFGEFGKLFQIEILIQFTYLSWASRCIFYIIIFENVSTMNIVFKLWINWFLCGQSEKVICYCFPAELVIHIYLICGRIEIKSYIIFEKKFKKNRFYKKKDWDNETWKCRKSAIFLKKRPESRSK